MDDEDSGLRAPCSPKPEDLSIGSGSEIRVKSELDFQSNMGLDGSDMEPANGDNPMSCLAIVHDETIEGTSSSSSAMLARLNAAAAGDHGHDQDIDVDVVGDDHEDVDVDGIGHGDEDEMDMKMNVSGMESDSGTEHGGRGSHGEEHRRRLFRSAHLAATPQNYTAGSHSRRDRDKNGNVASSGGRHSRGEGRGKRPFNLAGGASATLNNNNLSNNNNLHEKSPPLPPKRTRSVTNALATQPTHSNSTSPGGSVDSKDKGSGSPNSSVILMKNV